ncbi:hypothetical protein G6F46_005776 [Rhizopus delemar]|uniref:Arrestin-like N-terminal domain-containing protein n=2 Tax=Rhizopus TaxID=4842 RepID=A0A9P7CJ61_9FUNG|nr:hypothetical protein G6F55_009963 [Rhizopus delemar]KAG1535917.1 hypothetical protein G6F51_011259 [Rhizopus arrhizus]KAG1489263.1 hypothetical protein G6F54_011562 [Rhizopus delemar]KAG1509123.1 hypothetical protein G6F53_007680 [Rhizopus delemar]KAG1525305.1 hypothetical protein G6F52_003448 [Rhizopus delemar]
MVLSLTILPDTDMIDTFNNDTILPSEVYVMTGQVELSVLRPIQVSQLHVQFRGRVESLVGLSGLQLDEKHAVFGDEIPVDQWETIQRDRLGLVRKTCGQPLAILPLADEQRVLFDDLRWLPKGKTSWPFQLTLRRIHLLPPSMLTPHHKISYHLSARIKLASLIERVRLTCWHVCRSLRHDRPPEIQRQPERHQRQFLGASQPIKISRHAYPNLASVHHLQPVRYRGTRTRRIRYEICLRKFMCLQQKHVHFTCRFYPLCPQAVPTQLEFYLEQMEAYP